MSAATPYREPSRALTGIKLIELPCLDSQPFFAAAMAGKLFADLGAEVIKVEPPRRGSQERSRGPFRDEVPDPETGGLHLYLNTNKLGVTLDLEDARGRDLLLKLVADTDILLNPNMPGLNHRLRLDWRTLLQQFPHLIVTSLSFFGADSPYADFRAGDLVATHMSGVGYETPFNQVTDPENEPPLKPAGRQGDYLTGFTAASSAMCALLHRKRTGTGQHVDVSQWLAVMSMIRPTLGIHSHESRDAPYRLRTLTRRKSNLPWLYPCKDGWVSFSPLTDRFWRGTKRALSNPDWANDPMFDDRISRAGNSDVIEAALIDWFSTRDRLEIFERAQAEHVPCFPVFTPAEVATNPQYRERGYFVDSDHPAAGEIRMPGAPYKFSRTPWRIVHGAPRLGEHNRQIFCQRLGLTESELSALSDLKLI